MYPATTSISELEVFLREDFPAVDGRYAIDALTDHGVIVRLNPDARDIRPGNTISGPAMFALADMAIYISILSRVGLEALAVTTSATLNFMRKPEADQPLLCEANILKLGRGLVVCEAYIRQSEQLVAHATMTYSRPPKPSQS